MKFIMIFSYCFIAVSVPLILAHDPSEEGFSYLIAYPISLLSQVVILWTFPQHPQLEQVIPFQYHCQHFIIFSLFFNRAILTFTFIDDFIFLLLNFLINSFFLSHIQSFCTGVFSDFAFNYVLMDVFTEAVCSSVILLLIDISFEYDFSMLRNS